MILKLNVTGGVTGGVCEETGWWLNGRRRSRPRMEPLEFCDGETESSIYDTSYQWISKYE